MVQYSGQCHCGAVRFQFQGEAIRSGLRCNCTLCKRKGAAMTPYVIAPEVFQFDPDTPQLGVYQFGPGTAKHYFCKHCGIYTFHQTARVPDHFRANLGCIDALDETDLEISLFDGRHQL